MKKRIFLGLKEFNYIKKNKEFLKELFNLKEKGIEFFLILGKYEKDIDLKDFKEYFKKENIFYISKKYLESLSELDQKLKQEKYKTQKKEYYDEYYKIFFFQKECLFDQSEILYIGHDIWTDAYYLSNFTSVDFVLLKDILTNNADKKIPDIKDLYILDLNIDQIKEHLFSEKIYNYFPLNNYVKKQLYSKIFGKELFNSNLKIGNILKTDKHEHKKN